MAYTPEQVFQPGSYPELTYVERQSARDLLMALRTDGYVTSIVGPSKCGKTVLCEKVIGNKRIVKVGGARIDHIADLWSEVLRQLDIPVETELSEGGFQEATVGGEASGKAGLPILGGEVKLTGAARFGSSDTRTTRLAPAGALEAIEALKASNRVLVIDDFHYIPQATQTAIARQLKDAVRDGLCVVIVAIPHRSEDPIRSNPDLSGRVITITIPPWSDEELYQIPQIGFPLLDVSANENLVQALETESLGSPQLMQALCLWTCRENGLEEGGTPTAFRMDRCFGQACKAVGKTSNYETTFSKLIAGPKARGKHRTQYTFRDGRTGYIYEAVLRGLAENPATLNLTYEDIRKRIDSVITGATRASGSAIQGALLRMQSILDSESPEYRVMEWNNPLLNIVEPYFLHYLRWVVWPSGR